jgi:hypothetical protein
LVFCVSDESVELPPEKNFNDVLELIVIDVCGGTEIQSFLQRVIDKG